MNKIRKKIIVNEQYNSGASSSSSTVTTFDYLLTSSTVIDLTGKSGEVIINVASVNPTETLFQFTNDTNVTKITLRPKAGLVLTVYDTNGLGGGYNIYLNAATKVPDGNFKGFLELTKRNSVWYETNFIDQYNPLS